MKNIKYCSLMSGSSGNSQYIEVNGTKILVDVGASGKKIEESLKSIEVFPEDLSAILVTHEHKDHIRGVGILSRRYNIPIYANEGTWIGMKDYLGKIESKNIKLIDDKEFEIGNFGINTFKVYHDTNNPIGFTLHYLNKKVGILMDTGKVDGYIMKSIENCDILMIESNYDENLLKIGRYPLELKKRIIGKYGHLSNEESAKIIKNIPKKENSYIILGHLSQENNFPELAYMTVKNGLNDKFNENIKIRVANRERRTEIIEV